MSEVVLREWRRSDDSALVRLLEMQCKADPNWPPPYARDSDLAQWLGLPANICRWVAEEAGRVVGHMGLGTPSPMVMEIFNSARPDLAGRFVELCRTCVDEQARGSGVAGLLTRAAIKTALAGQTVPVATVLTNREGWLEMMRRTRWQEIGRVPAVTMDDELVCFLPPKKFVDAVSL